jgi:hypothetical protein
MITGRNQHPDLRSVATHAPPRALQCVTSRIMPAIVDTAVRIPATWPPHARPLQPWLAATALPCTPPPPCSHTPSRHAAALSP